jgi:predicted Zn-dependent protease
MRNIIESIGLFTLVQAFFGDVSGIAAVFVDSGAQLLSLRFSRDFEREADDRGWEYLIESSVNPWGMISFFSKLLEEQSISGVPGEVQETLSFVSTHPSTQARIEYLREKWKEVEGQKWNDLSHVDFRQFQETLRRSAANNKGKGEEANGSDN